jgi:excinuclease UvrABC ATPase subunit
MYSEHFARRTMGCPSASWSRGTSFNSPHGACRECTGLGVKMELTRE